MAMHAWRSRPFVEWPSVHECCSRESSCRSVFVFCPSSVAHSLASVFTLSSLSSLSFEAALLALLFPLALLDAQDHFCSRSRLRPL
eukprot:5011062-Pleurochrysis_carterae.AAC.1